VSVEFSQLRQHQRLRLGIRVVMCRSENLWLTREIIAERGSRRLEPSPKLPRCPSSSVCYCLKNMQERAAGE
jgi:hypothetical protein